MVAFVTYFTTNRHKLDKKSQKHVFVGYCTKSKAYRLYEPLSGKITISRDVVFDEHTSWDWKAKDDEKNPQLEIEEEKNIAEQLEPEDDVEGSQFSTPENIDSTSSEKPPKESSQLRRSASSEEPPKV